MMEFKEENHTMEVEEVKLEWEEHLEALCAEPETLQEPPEEVDSLTTDQQDQSPETSLSAAEEPLVRWNPLILAPLSPADQEIFTCGECTASFVLAAELQHHRLRCHKPETRFCCTLCPFESLDEELSKQHWYSQHTDQGESSAMKRIPANFPCEICPEVLYTEQYRDIHMKTMHNFQLLCDQCNSEPFSSITSLRQHYLNHHKDEAYLNKQTPYLEEILKNSFPVFRIFTCYICHKKRFKKKYQLAQHIMLDHFKLNVFCCNVCCFISLCQNVLRKHKAYCSPSNVSCTASEPDSYSLCSEQTGRFIIRHENFENFVEYEMKKHQREKHNGIVTCKKNKRLQCTLTFKSHIDMMKHFHSQHVSLVTCDLCRERILLYNTADGRLFDAKYKAWRDDCVAKNIEQIRQVCLGSPGNAEDNLAKENPAKNKDATKKSPAKKKKLIVEGDIFATKCAACDHYFTRKASLKLHMKEYHPVSMSEVERLDNCRSSKSFVKCSYCSQQFSTQDQQKAHVFDYHARYRCSECNLLIDGTLAAQSHSTVFHEGGGTCHPIKNGRSDFIQTLCSPNSPKPQERVLHLNKSKRKSSPPGTMNFKLVKTQSQKRKRLNSKKATQLKQITSRLRRIAPAMGVDDLTLSSSPSPPDIVQESILCGESTSQTFQNHAKSYTPRAPQELSGTYWRPLPSASHATEPSERRTILPADSSSFQSSNHTAPIISTPAVCSQQIDSSLPISDLHYLSIPPVSRSSTTQYAYSSGNLHMEPQLDNSDTSEMDEVDISEEIAKLTRSQNPAGSGELMEARSVGVEVLDLLETLQSCGHAPVGITLEELSGVMSLWERRVTSDPYPQHLPPVPRGCLPCSVQLDYPSHVAFL